MVDLRSVTDPQARLAQRLGLPLLLHARKGFYEAFSLLRKAGFDQGGAAHAFSGSRDMARLGLVMVNGGKWNGRQLIPADWVVESTKRRIRAADMAAGGELGYGYLWWLPSDSRTGPCALSRCTGR